ncbi:MAG: hypothetical protein WAU01_10765, partial [Saprospiraceae bacterium]
MSVKTICILWVWAGLVYIATGQTMLNTEVTLHHHNKSAKVVFKDIQQQTGAVFSYSDFQDDKKMSIQVSKTLLKNVIPLLETELQISIIIKDKYLIVRSNVPIQTQEQNISGTILNPSSKEPISDASVFVKKHKILVNTDSRGKFAFSVPSDIKQVRINIAKANHIDTSFVILASESQSIHVYLRTFPRKSISEFDSLYPKEIQIESIFEQKIPETPPVQALSYNENFWDKMERKNVNLININDTIFNKFSVSLLPPISTNKLLSFHTKNVISLNIIGGNSKGLDGVELGGVYNYD